MARIPRFVLLSTLALVGCSASHGDRPTCELAGGRCQTPDLPCGEGLTFAGYEMCGATGNNACCIPTTPADAGLPADAGSPADAGLPAVQDSGARTANVIVCGDSECDAATQGCIASCIDVLDERTPACVALNETGTWPAAACPGERERFPRFWLTCDGSEDCSDGEICHLIFGSAGQYANCHACEPPCDVSAIHMLCRADADCGAPALHCEPNPSLPGYSTCERDSP